MDYDAFRDEWLGRRIDYDHVYGYQCVDLILQYIHECYGLNQGVWGNAIDYWDSPSAPLFSKFFKTTDTNVNQGDIVIVHGLPGNPYGHIGIATGQQNGDAIEILEQNGNGGGDGVGPNAIRTRYVSRGRLAGMLRPIEVARAPAAAPAPPNRPFSTELITPKQMKFLRPTHRWDLNQTTWIGLTEHAEAAADENSPPITVTAVAHHNLGGVYYLTADSEDSGFNQVDLIDYVAPIVPEQPPAPRPQPAGAYTVPSGRRYIVVKAILGYPTATKAGNHDSSNAIVHAGEYNVFNIYPGRDDLINVKSDDGSIWSWINTADNVPDPIPEPTPPPPPDPLPVSQWPAGSNPREAIPAPPIDVPAPVEPPPLPTPPPAPVDPNAWKNTMAFKDSSGNSKVVRYVALKDFVVHDLDGKLRDSDPIKQGTIIHLGGTFKGPDGIRYGRTPSSMKNFNWYGVPLNLVDLAVYDISSNAAIRNFLGTANLSDHLVTSFAKLENTFEKAFDIIKLKPKK